MLFEISQSLFALELTLISGANERFKKKSAERTEKIQILSGSLMSDVRKKESSNSKSDFKDQTIKIVEKRIKMHDLYIF